jgi:hypothetical protein
VVLEVQSDHAGLSPLSGAVIRGGSLMAAR